MGEYLQEQYFLKYLELDLEKKRRKKEFQDGLNYYEKFNSNKKEIKND